ncbi:MAG TPA: hypothetical protein VLV78_10440 [Thermoanaerobaculia bacterium]|nr:hypothetical protein [Thermoanaerobaculia bacterium]
MHEQLMTITVCALSLLAASRGPWEWTAAERAQARQGVHVIDGDVNPELFFPTELFETLVRSLVNMPAVYPQMVRQRSSDLFRNLAEWGRFREIVADYAVTLEEERAAADALDKAKVSALQERKQADACHALREARRAFGRERFDRMLYETVPPGTKTSFTSDTAFEREKRCQ